MANPLKVTVTFRDDFADRTGILTLSQTFTGEQVETIRRERLSALQVLIMRAGVMTGESAIQYVRGVQYA